ncbi:hypothetical protein ACFL1G_12270 [Planctomycetota bacterium]
MRTTTFLLICFFSAIPCAAETVIVDDNGPADFNNIQAAINAANDFDIIEVLPGLYTGFGNKNIDFNSKAVTVRSTNPNDPNIVAITIIDCEKNGRGFYFHKGEDPNSILEGLTITNGYMKKGGGIYCYESNPTIRRCVIENSVAYGGWLNVGGGGIFCHKANPTLIGCVLNKNQSISSVGGWGGGMYNLNSKPIIIGCTFTNNKVKIEEILKNNGGAVLNNNSTTLFKDCKFISNFSSERGGAISNVGGKLTLINCEFANNKSSRFGGAIYKGSGTIENCTFLENKASIFDGGAIYGGSWKIANCTFNKNTAQDKGGAIYKGSGTISDCNFIKNKAKLGGAIQNSSAQFVNCTFTGNSAEMGAGIRNYEKLDKSPSFVNCVFINNKASDNGGGIYNDRSHPTLINCLFVGNKCKGIGGGMRNYKSKPAIINCIFSDNRAKNGGGIYNQGNSNITLINSILWTNIDENGMGQSAQIHNYQSTPLVNYCCIQGWTGGMGGVGNFGTDPCFVEPGYWESNVNWIEGDYHLLPSSPCIDNGDNNSIPMDFIDLDGDLNKNELIPFDLDRKNRMVDGDYDCTKVVDIGAFEFMESPLEVPMNFTPTTQNHNRKGRWVKAHFVLPEVFDFEDVDVDCPVKIIEPLELECDHMNIFVNEEGLVEIEAAFDQNDFYTVGVSGGTVEIVVTGMFFQGPYFIGTDIVRIINIKNLEHLSLFLSHWLDLNCNEPDWCNGSDFNQDSIVNFEDFTLFAQDWLKCNVDPPEVCWE